MSSSAAGAAPRTPRHPWVVGVVTLLWNCVGALDYVMTQAKNEAGTKGFGKAQVDWFFGFPSRIVGAWAAAVWGGVAGSLSLLLRKSVALPVLIVSLVGACVTTIHHLGLCRPSLELGGDLCDHCPLAGGRRGRRSASSTRSGSSSGVRASTSPIVRALHRRSDARRRAAAPPLRLRPSSVSRPHGTTSRVGRGAESGSDAQLGRTRRHEPELR